MGEFMFNRNGWGYLKINAAVLAICIFTLVGLGLAADNGPLPASNWNPENLNKIQAAKTADPLTFAVLGDNREHPEILGQFLKLIDNDPSLSFAIHLGDMVKEGDLEHYRPFFQEVRRNLHKPMLTVIGNHELCDEGLKLNRSLFGRDYYSFAKNDDYFIIIDDADGKVAPEQIHWLKGELQKSQSYKARLVFLHIPLYDPRGGNNQHCLPSAEASRMLALFKKYKVTHVFAAHIHDYYAGAWEGLPYTISGGAGAPLYGADPQHAFFHYLKVSIQGDQVQIQVRPLPQPKSP